MAVSSSSSKLTPLLSRDDTTFAFLECMDIVALVQLDALSKRMQHQVQDYFNVGLTTISGLFFASCNGKEVLHHAIGALLHRTSSTPLRSSPALQLYGVSVRMEDTDFAELCKATRDIEILDLSLCTKLTDAALVHLRSLKGLRRLTLRWCDQLLTLASCSWRYLLSSKVLTWVRARNSLEPASRSSIRCLSLQSLDLMGCQRLGDADLDHLCRLHWLQVLNLGSCERITDPGLQRLGRIKSLQNLSLAWCMELTDSGLRYLSTLEHLHTLNISVCTLPTDCGILHLHEIKALQNVDVFVC